MKKTLSTILALVMSLCLVLGCVSFAAAEEEAPSGMNATAFLMFANADWSAQYMSPNDETKLTVKNANVTGAGEYTVGLEFPEGSEGLAFAALAIDGGEISFPTYTIEIKEIRVNGEAIPFTKGYTSSDDGVTTRMNIYNEWVSDLPADARSFDGKTDDASPIIVDKEAFASVTSVEVDFVVHQYGVDTAFLMYADSAWAHQFWYDGNPYPVTATTAAIDGFGDYTVGLAFEEEAQGLAFAAIGIANGEKTYPGAYLKINEIRVNGEAVAFKKGYTSSDDGVTTRMNIYNEWVSEIPADAHSFDGTVEDAAAIIVDPEAFAAVKTVEVDFSLLPVTDVAFLMYADSAWTHQFWYDGNPYPVTATTAVVNGQGSYTVGLEFEEEAQGLAFAAVGIANGEKTFNGYFIDITEIKVNGEPINFKAGYTSSDDGVVTRENIFNEWVSDLPADARRADGVLEGASPIIVDPADFASVKTVEVTFDYIYGKPIVKDESAPLTEEEAAELLKVDYNAYIGVQTENYIFRNTWDEANYGRDSADNPGFFARLTGWDADNNAVDYGGTFEDVLLTKDGTYTVSLTTGDMGFGSDSFFRMLFVSTEIPSRLVEEGFVKIEDVQVKIGDAATQKYTDVDTSGTYARIIIIDEYNRGEAPFGYTVPGANATISITFTVTGLTD